jgi:hypothetical protein
MKAIKIESMTLLGGFLAKAEMNNGTAGLGRPKLGTSKREAPKGVPTLASLGLTKKESAQ